MLEKARLFSWLCVNNKILTRVNLFRKGYLKIKDCVLCGEAEETIDHLLLDCSHSKSVWTRLLLDLRLPELPTTLDKLWDSWRSGIGNVQQRQGVDVLLVYGKRGTKESSSFIPSLQRWLFRELPTLYLLWMSQLKIRQMELMAPIRDIFQRKS